MDINKNQQVNTFLKGMNTDLSDSLLDSSQYRYAENLRLVTNTDSNSGELRLIDGTSVRYEFTDRIIYLNSIREYVVVITKNDTNNTWSVHVSNNKGSDFTTIFGPCTEALWNENEEPAICGILRWESDNNIKLYITDDTGNHSIIPIQIAYDKWPSDAITEFSTLSGYQNTPLVAPTIQIGSSTGGTLKPAKLQYAYRLFKTGGAATTLSPLSCVLSIRKTENQGYSATETSNKTVEISVDVSNVSGLDSIQIFRINYIQNGQAPTIHRICERRINDNQNTFSFTDFGVNEEQLGVSEFISLNTMDLKPKVIESKGDTLFAANIRYTQDDVDNKFSEYDAKSFSSGNYWKLRNPGEGENDEQNIVFQFPTAEDIESDGGFAKDRTRTEEADLCHRQFTENNNYAYNEEWWHPLTGLASSADISKIGGKGTNIDWELASEWVAFRYDLNAGEFYVGETDDTNLGQNTYKHDETYRFGIVLYDDKGRASSVKWIADIRIPPLRVTGSNSDDIRFQGGNTVYMNRYYVKFTVKHIPERCSGYQIVQCPRTISDRHILTQGIVGRPLMEYIPNSQHNFEPSDNMCPSGLMTLQDMFCECFYKNRGTNHSHWIRAYQGDRGLVPYFSTDSTNAGDEFDDGDYDMARTASSVQDVIQFASPEYAFQADDIKDILNTYKSSIRLEPVVSYNTAGDFIKHTFDADYYNPAYSVHENSIDTITSGYTAVDNIYVNVHQDINNTIDKMPYRFRLAAYSKNGDEYETYLRSDLDVVGQINADGNVFWGVNRIPEGERARLKYIENYDKLGTFLSFNYIKPNSINNDNVTISYSDGVNAISYPDVPEWNKFANGDNIRFADDVTAIGTYSYINWSAPLMLDAQSTDSLKRLYKDVGTINIGVDAWFDEHMSHNRYLYPVGTGGKCILFKLNDKIAFNQNNFYYLKYTSQSSLNKFAPIHIANIVKDVHPYGGYTKHAIDNSTYISTGCFESVGNPSEWQPRASNVKAGDAYVGIFKYNAAHLWDDAQYKNVTRMATVYAVPIESDIDLTAQYGDTFSGQGDKAYYIQDKPASFDGYSQTKEAYMYNTAYNQTPNIMTYSPTVYNEVSNFNWDTRIHNSELKTNGETIDSWLTFKAMNFLDVDSRFGEITYMKLFKDRLLYWQDKAFGIVSSNERTALTDTNNNQIILGNGGILQRFDYISTIYGMKPNQFVSTQSNHNLYFWDGHEKEILAYGEALVPLTTIKGIRNHINKHDEVAKPCMFYDNKNKEVVSSVVEGGSIAYSEQTEAFTSIYTYTPLYHTDVFEDMLSATEHSLHLHNVQQPLVTLFGDTNQALPKLQYVVNTDATMPKVFDIQTFGGRFYGGDNISDLQFKYNTPLKQESSCTGTSVTNREYDFRLDIPRNNNDAYGGRMRGKTMQCEFTSTSNSSDFSLQYIITKYRMSWS